MSLEFTKQTQMKSNIMKYKVNNILKIYLDEIILIPK